MHSIVHWTPSNEPPELQPDSIHIWRIDLDHPPGSLDQLLSPDEIERAERLIRKPLRQHYTVARGGMRYILGGYLGVPGDELSFDYGAEGKPTLREGGSDLQFNLSHCGEMALLALSTQNIGIDLEQLQQRPNLQQIAERMLPQEIQQKLSGLDGDALTQTFFRYWTAMESCAKCRGVGIFGRSGERGDCHIKHITPEPGWIACVATETPLSEAESWSSYRLNLPVLIK
jgi:4'-phosphopantetheinyl transferase